MSLSNTWYNRSIISNLIIELLKSLCINLDYVLYYLHLYLWLVMSHCSSLNYKQICSYKDPSNSIWSSTSSSCFLKEASCSPNPTRKPIFPSIEASLSTALVIYFPFADRLVKVNDHEDNMVLFMSKQNLSLQTISFNLTTMFLTSKGVFVPANDISHKFWWHLWALACVASYWTYIYYVTVFLWKYIIIISKRSCVLYSCITI